MGAGNREKLEWTNQVFPRELGKEIQRITFLVLHQNFIGKSFESQVERAPKHIINVLYFIH